MEYNVTGLNDLSKQFSEFQTRMGFTDSNVSQRLMLVVSEVSEAFEAFRKGKYANLTAFNDSMKDWKIEYSDYDRKLQSDFEIYIKDALEDEMADVIIRALAFCGENNIDIESHVKLKMAYNELRGFKYGGKSF